MAAAYGGWVAFTGLAAARYDKAGWDSWTIVFVVFIGASIAFGIFALFKASKIGREEDRRKREDDQREKDRFNKEMELINEQLKKLNSPTIPYSGG